MCHVIIPEFFYKKRCSQFDSSNSVAFYPIDPDATG